MVQDHDATSQNCIRRALRYVSAFVGKRLLYFGVALTVSPYGMMFWPHPFIIRQLVHVGV
jgi:hypothetical protein